MNNVRSEAERLAERVTRIERILLALALDALNDGTRRAHGDEIREILKKMTNDMERSFETGQV